MSLSNFIQKLFVYGILLSVLLESHKFFVLVNKSSIDEYPLTRTLGETFTFISGLNYGYNSSRTNYVLPISKEYRTETKTTPSWTYTHLVFCLVHSYVFFVLYGQSTRLGEISFFLTQLIFFFGVYQNAHNFLGKPEETAKTINYSAMVLLFAINLLRQTRLNEKKWMDLVYLFVFTLTANMSSCVTIMTLYNYFV